MKKETIEPPLSHAPAPHANIICYMVPIATLLLFRYLLPVNICDDAYISLKVATNARFFSSSGSIDDRLVWVVKA